MEQSSKSKNTYTAKSAKDCYHYQVERSCSAGDGCPFYHRDLAPDICVKFIFGECQQRAGQKRCSNLHVRDSYLPFPPSSEVARIRRLQQSVVAVVAPATPASMLSRPGQLRNIKRLLGGRKWLQVKILQVQSELLLHVRPADVVEEAFQSSEQVNTFYCSQAGKEVRLTTYQPGQLCAVLCGQAWYRAVVVRNQKQEEEEELILVQLLDEGEVVSVHISQLCQLEQKFQYGPCWYLPCHLAKVTNCQLDMASKIDSVLTEVENPQLEVLGSPLLTGKDQFSVPVDIRWEQLAVSDDPFLPLQMEDCSLSAVLVEMGIAEWIEVEKVDKEDLEKKESNSENEKEDNQIVPEFGLVHPMKENRNFRWLDPELPASQQFEARGTFVDDSGQIYLQQQGQRDTIRLVRSLLQEKFFSSEPDCDPGSWRRMEECVVRWKDGLWYRSRFIDYVAGDHRVGEAVVLLVDYGDTYRVEVQHLRRTIYCHDIPIQCIRAILHNVIPSREKVWSVSCLDFLQEKIHYSKLDCNELLRVKVETDLAVQPLPVSIKLCPPSGLGDYEDLVWVDLAMLLDMIREAKIVQPPLVLSDPMKLMRKDFGFGVKFVPPGFYKDKGGVHTILGLTFPSLDWEEVGIRENDLLEVKIVDMESYKTVYVQLCDGGDRYLAKLQNSYMEMASLVMGQVVRRPMVGQAVGVWWEGEGWCRAVVRERGDMGRFFVEFVDFGTKDWVEGYKLRQVPAEWLTLPTLAVRIELGIEVKGGMDENLVCELVWESLSKTAEPMLVRVEQLVDTGKLMGQLLQCDSLELVYQDLVRDGHVKVVSHKLGN